MAVEHHHGEHHKLVEAAWEATGGDRPLRSYGTFQELFDSMPLRNKLLELVPGVPLYVVCIDERLIGGLGLTPATENYVRLAGEGILNPNAAEDLKGAGVVGIVAHTECGAKGIYATGKEGHPDHIGMEAVHGLAKRARIPVVRTIDPRQFRTPLHDARAIYYDGTGRFDWSRVEGCALPPGFIVTRSIISDPRYAQTEVAVATGIAHGSHGLGNKFTDKSPLYLVGITDNQPGSVRAEKLVSELRAVADKHQAVAVDLIIAR